MKKCLSVLCIIVMLFLAACNPPAPSTNPTLPPSPTPEPPPVVDPIETMEDLTELEDVISVTEQALSSQIAGAVAYKLLYTSENGRLAADIVLPEDYTNENKAYPVLIYFPEVRTYLDSLASQYALGGVIVIRPYARGSDESEGRHDLGGARDLADAQKLLEIFDQTEFIKNRKIFVAGSSEGSITALRLFAQDTEQRISGCAVTDVIPDLYACGVARGEGVQNYFASFIGKTYEEAPEEYALRSATQFSDKLLNRPLLLIHYLKNPATPLEITEAFYASLSGNEQVDYHKIDLLTADFQGEGYQRLLSFINKYD